MTYCFICDSCGTKIEYQLPVSERKKEIVCANCSKLMRRDIVAEHSGRPDTPSNWPQESDAMGVHPAQAKKYSDYLRDKGVPTEINSDGNPILTSQHHRKRVCAATDTYDRNAGYGDQSRQTPLPERTPRRRHGR